MNFGAEGCITEPLEMVTEFSPTSLTIIEQPIINYTLVNNSNMSEIRLVYQRSGDFLPKV